MKVVWLVCLLSVGAPFCLLSVIDSLLTGDGSWPFLEQTGLPVAELSSTMVSAVSFISSRSILSPLNP